SLVNASYAQYDERDFVRGTFQLQEIAGSMPFSEDPGRETSCVYDILGNKVQEADASGHSQSWSYNTAADSRDQLNFTINRLTSTTSTGIGNPGWFNLNDDQHLNWLGDFTGAGRTEILFWANDGNWWLGTGSGSQLNWAMVGNPGWFNLN